MHPNSLRVSTLALVVVALSGCSYKPKPDEILMGLPHAEYRHLCAGNRCRILRGPQ